MPTLRLKVDLASAGTNSNIVSGERFEFAAVPTACQVFAIAHDDGALSNTNILPQSIQMSVSFTNAVVADDVFIPAKTVLDRSGDLITSGVMDAGDRLIISLKNNTAAAADVIVLIELTPLT